MATSFKIDIHSHANEDGNLPYPKPILKGPQVEEPEILKDAATPPPPPAPPVIPPGGGGTTGGVGGGVGQALAGTGPLIPILASLAATAAVVNTELELSEEAYRRLREQLEDMPSLLTTAQVEQDLLDFQQNLQRANRFGSQLADIERLSREGDRLETRILDDLSEPFLELNKTFNEAYNEILKVLEPVIEIANEVGVISGGLQNTITLLKSITATLRFLRTLRSDAAIKIIDALPLTRDLKKALKKYLKEDKSPSDFGGDFIKELNQFMNLDLKGVDDDVQFAFVDLEENNG